MRAFNELSASLRTNLYAIQNNEFIKKEDLYAIQNNEF